MKSFLLTEEEKGPYISAFNLSLTIEEKKMKKTLAICLSIIGILCASQRVEAYGCCDSYMDTCCPSPTCCYYPYDDCCDCCIGGCCKPGLYVGGEAGYAWIQTPTHDKPDVNIIHEDEELHVNSDRGRFAWGAFGGYNMRLCSPCFYVGVEGGYNDNGYSEFCIKSCYFTEDEIHEEAFHRLKMRSRDWSLSGTFTYVACRCFNAFVKIGAACVRETLNPHKHGCKQNGTEIKEEIDKLFCRESDCQWAAAVKTGFGYCLFDCINIYASYRGVFCKSHDKFCDLFKDVSCDEEKPLFRLKRCSTVHSVYGGLTYSF